VRAVRLDIALVQAHDPSAKEGKIMSKNILRLRLVVRALYLIVFCQGFTLSATAAGAQNITGTWQLNHPESDTPHQNVQQIVGRRGVLIDSMGDQLQTERGMPYDGLVLMIAGMSSPPEKLAVSLNDSEVTLSDRNGASLTLHTDGRVEELRGGIQIISRCVNDALIITTVTPLVTTKMTFNTAREGDQMLVVSEADLPEVGPVVARYSYDYESSDRTFSSSFWQLHPPANGRDQERMEELAHKSDILLEQINKEMSASKWTEVHSPK
jgi:hypothetical protein